MVLLSESLLCLPMVVNLFLLCQYEWTTVNSLTTQHFFFFFVCWLNHRSVGISGRNYPGTLEPDRYWSDLLEKEVVCRQGETLHEVRSLRDSFQLRSESTGVAAVSRPTITTWQYLLYRLSSSWAVVASPPLAEATDPCPSSQW